MTANPTCTAVPDMTRLAFTYVYKSYVLRVTQTKGPSVPYSMSNAVFASSSAVTKLPAHLSCNARPQKPPAIQDAAGITLTFTRAEKCLHKAYILEVPRANKLKS